MQSADIDCLNRGADILATAGNYQVFMPDFFEGNPCDLSWHPATTEEQKKKLGAWFPTRMPVKGVEKIPKILKDLGNYNPGIKKWGVIGVSISNTSTMFRQQWTPSSMLTL